jgi:hypothetical protein
VQSTAFGRHGPTVGKISVGATSASADFANEIPYARKELFVIHMNYEQSASGKVTASQTVAAGRRKLRTYLKRFRFYEPRPISGPCGVHRGGGSAYLLVASACRCLHRTRL